MSAADKRRAWHSYIARTYSLTSEQYDRLVCDALGRCGICGCIPRKPAIDHDHRTGFVRGFLCAGCNLGLGWWEAGRTRWLFFMPKWTKRFWQLEDRDARIRAYLAGR
jgi:hypothetical protein